MKRTKQLFLIIKRVGPEIIVLSSYPVEIQNVHFPGPWPRLWFLPSGLEISEKWWQFPDTSKTTEIPATYFRETGIATQVSSATIFQKKKKKQTAWTQEAYHPNRTSVLFLCGGVEGRTPILAGGYSWVLRWVGYSYPGGGRGGGSTFFGMRAV